MFFIASCTSSNKFDLDVSETSVDVKIKRFDKDLVALNANSTPEEILDFKLKYGAFGELFVKNIINTGPIDTAISPALEAFINDQDIVNVYEECQLAYPNLNDIEAQLSDAFARYSYYFKGAKVPEVIAFVSGFNYSIVASDSSLGIGLDMYLGKEYEYYFMLRYPEYKRRNMIENSISADCIKGWITSEYVMDKQASLAGQMIYYGKVLYVMDALFPYLNDYEKIGFSKEQLLWCENNESNVWAFFIDKELLYSTDPSETIKYLGEAPFTTGFSKESPGRTGWWIGWQIVRSYMNNYPETTVLELMELDNNQDILTKSKYKPRR